MLATKRRADEPLLPLRAPKRPRTTANHRVGGPNSLSPHDGLPNRWVNIGLEFMALLWDTAVNVIGVFQDDQSDSVPTSPSHVPSEEPQQDQIPSPSLSPPPPAPTSTAARPPRQIIPPFSGQLSQPQRPIPPPSSHSIHLRIPTTRSYRPEKQRQTQLKGENDQRNAVASTSKNTLSAPQDPKVSGLPGDTQSFGLMSPPSTQASSSSIRSTVAQTYPEVAAALQQQQNRKKSSKPQQKQNYIERPHILEKQHKSRVREEAKKRREEIEKDIRDLYDLKRRAGYGSGLPEFRDYLTYGSRLELLGKTGALTPSSSLGDLRSWARQNENKRRSLPDGIDPDFVKRAIQRAQDALKVPPPPPPFIPSLEQLRLGRLAKDKKIEDQLRPGPLPPALSPKDDTAVDALFRKRGCIIAKCAREQVEDKDIARLRPNNWLNDEIINFYGQLILSRSEESKENLATGLRPWWKKPLNVHYFNTFFWPKLQTQGYEKARLGKWTKNIDLFAKDIILIPINHSNSHWTAAAINFRKKRIESYDSMGIPRPTVLKLLRQYLDDEHKNKKKKPFDFTGWIDYAPPNTPQQENGVDCGVFTCQFLESLSRGQDNFGFTQSNMPYLRRRMVWEIGNVKLREDP